MIQTWRLDNIQDLNFSVDIKLLRATFTPDPKYTSNFFIYFNEIMQKPTKIGHDLQENKLLQK